MGVSAEPILIAGAGIAGLTAALAFATRGFHVRVFEKSARFEEVGAGIQISPNATRILQKLGVVDELLPKAVKPHSIILRDAKSLAELARVALGPEQEQRWGAPYIVAHRADLQKALLEAASRLTSVEIVTDATITGMHSQESVTADVLRAGESKQEIGQLLVAADGVWSRLRGLTGPYEKSRFSGELAWRTVLDGESAEAQALRNMGAADSVTAFLHSGFHLIAYPVRGGAAFNLVAFTPGQRITEGWSGEADVSILRDAMRSTAPALSRLAENAGPWTAWPIHTADPKTRWTARGLALIGDAAHAMTPFAAQGAAMAIEDADTLANAVAALPDDLPVALTGWETSRRPRIERVAKRGAFNHFAWQAKGPIALARNLVLKTRSPEKLAADMDWLYRWGD